MAVGENIAEALRYASHGYKVYPVWGIKDGKCLCGGLKGCRPGKHPWGKAVPHGEKDATTDEATIRRWFKMPVVNVGVSIDGVVVLDLDKKHGGMDTLANWERKHGALPLTPTVKSGGGGRHFVFKHPGVPLNPKPARGVDCLWGNGGGWVVPPSLHASGNRYEWLVSLETPLAAMPPWLVEIVAECPLPLRGSGVRLDDFDPMDGFVDSVPTFADLGMLPAGCRNDAVNRTIGSMLGNGFTPEQITEDGLRWAEMQESPYSADDLREKVRHFGRKHEVEINDLQYPQIVPLHQGESCSPFAVRPSLCPSGVVVAPTPIAPIDGEHFFGLLGDFVRAVEPFTEADPLGILVCLLGGVGNALGRNVHHRIGRRHGTNLFVMLIGTSGNDRKGTCWDVAETLLTLANPAWADSCLENGLGSGQGLIDRIRDAQGDDAGVPDKRLMVVEEEFAKPMRLMRSESSILSANLRAAYDGKPLAVLNRGENRYGCREPHASIVGMITPEELLEQLKGRSEMHNGFLNRFLLIGVKRTRYLPCGADYGKVCRDYADRLREAVERAAALREPLGVAEDAAAFWDAEYRRLEAERPGNYGKATARLSVHALKVALVYAALEGSPSIRLSHLRAALSLIAHADRTAFDLFGTASAVAPCEEPPHAKLLTLARTRSDGIIKTDAFRLFSNKRKASEIDADFALLTENGFGRWEGTRWFARKPECDMGGGVANEIKAVCETVNGEERGSL